MCISTTERSSSSFTRESPLLTFTNTLQMKNILVTCTVQSSYFALVELQKKGGHLISKKQKWFDVLPKNKLIHTQICFISACFQTIFTLLRDKPQILQVIIQVYIQTIQQICPEYESVCVRVRSWNGQHSPLQVETINSSENKKKTVLSVDKQNYEGWWWCPKLECLVRMKISFQMHPRSCCSNIVRP